MAKPVPDGYTAVTPYLIVKDVQAQLDFCTRAFGATVHMKMQMPDGSIGHCDVSINGAHVMMGQARPPQHEAMPCMIQRDVPRVPSTTTRSPIKPRWLRQRSSRNGMSLDSSCR